MIGNNKLVIKNLSKAFEDSVKVQALEDRRGTAHRHNSVRHEEHL
jgi:hypothetical protein